MILRQFFTVLFVSAMAFIALNAQLKEFNHPSILSFETGVSPASAGVGSMLSVTDMHYKHGRSSLQWNWTTDKVQLHFKQHIPYAAQNPHADNSVATFVFWLFSPQPLPNAHLVFEFLKNDVICSSFTYKLNFYGWSGAWVAFDRDMQGQAVAGMDELRVRIEGAQHGQLLFDHVMLSSFQDVRHHTADFQAPFINANTNSHWLTLLHSWNKQFDISTKDELTNNFVADIDTLEKRLQSVFSERAKVQSFSSIQKRFNIYDIRHHDDGSVSGLPIFFERYGETYERLGAPRYNLLYANEMGLVRANRLMFDMAIAYNATQNIDMRQNIESMYVSFVKHMLCQGFRAGSAMGTLHHLGYSMRQYYAASFLMRDVLRKHHLANDVQAATEWFAGTGEVKTQPEVLGMDVDAFNTSLTGRLASILMLTHSPEKIRYIKAFVRWVDNGMLYSEGTAGTFKIDGSIFHHRHNYPAYAVGGLEGAVNAVNLFARTSFAISATAHNNLKQALLAMRYYCNLRTWPLPLSGRHPDGAGELVPQHFAKLALAGSADGLQNVDRELAAAYMRLTPDSNTYYTQMFTAMGIEPEAHPQGHRSFPYSSLSVHRRNNWMAIAMGHSRYLWSTEIYLGANLYGRYMTHGHLQIVASGSPISNFGSGFRQEGWDWNHFPGTTAAVLPLSELRADVKNLDGDSGYEELLLSDESFAGSLVHNQWNGMYAMKLHEHDKYNGSLRANKSYFFFDNQIIALGSNIRSALPNEVHTTLFQVYQHAQNAHVLLNGKNTRNNTSYNNAFAKHSTLSDGLNNYYFVKNAAVSLHRQVQHSFHEETDAPTQNPFALAYINHGAMAQQSNYEYMVLVQPNARELKQTSKAIRAAKNSIYSVLRSDSLAHILYHNKSKTTAMALFEHGTYRTMQQTIATDTPCLLMLQHLPNKLLLSVANPDLAFYQGPSDDQYDAQGRRIERSVYSRTWINHTAAPSTITLTIDGHWHVSPNTNDAQYFTASYDANNNSTSLTVLTQHGISREIVLVKK